MGGKSRIAKEIADVIAPRGLWWEPFCGGLSVSVQLARHYPGGLVSDANAALIACYAAVREGWEPPRAFSDRAYLEAKTLPDSDPIKAFAGFGMSFSGKWFAGYGGDSDTRAYRKRGEPERYLTEGRAAAAAKSLLRDVPRLSDCGLQRLDFLAVIPEKVAICPECIYADPPYAGTTGYAATGAFDHALFWDLCRRWACRNTRVFVSSYVAPSDFWPVWEKEHRDMLWNRRGERTLKTERLFLAGVRPVLA